MRFGLDAELVTDISGGIKPVRGAISEWIDRCSGIIGSLGYDPYIATLMKVLEFGNSSARQRAVSADTRSIWDVAQHNVDEHYARRPRWYP
jgi:gamma-glutamyl:cysteine ligase YbdK (ATP-grasp superfamily)